MKIKYKGNKLRKVCLERGVIKLYPGEEYELTQEEYNSIKDKTGIEKKNKKLKNGGK